MILASEGTARPFPIAWILPSAMMTVPSAMVPCVTVKIVPPRMTMGRSRGPGPRRAPGQGDPDGDDESSGRSCSRRSSSLSGLAGPVRT